MVSIHQTAFDYIQNCIAGEYLLIGWAPQKIFMVLPSVPEETKNTLLPGGAYIMGKLIVTDSEEQINWDLSQVIFLIKSRSSTAVFVREDSEFKERELKVFKNDQFSILFTHTEVLQSEVPDLMNNVILRVSGESARIEKYSLGISTKLEPVRILFNISQGPSDSVPVIQAAPYEREEYIRISWCTVYDPSTPSTVALEAHKDKLAQILAVLPNYKSVRCFNTDFSVLPFCIGVRQDDIEERQMYHQLLKLPLDWAVLDEQAQISLHTGLIDVHIPLLQNTSKDVGDKYTIQGHYAYFHYNQDINDKGWGCAYRSLQTLISWMQFQRLTVKKVPSIVEIQEILEGLGDKPSGFSGSSEWIGAYEVMLVLNEYCGIESRILNFPSGRDIQDKVRELVYHFEDEGTPVMIGGGVLAYTLLGVQYDEDTGKSKFLILDPHYLGKDETKVIIDKRYCDWKGPDIFRTDAHYNFCMPIRPKGLMLTSHK